MVIYDEFYAINTLWSQNYKIPIIFIILSGINNEQTCKKWKNSELKWMYEDKIIIIYEPSKDSETYFH